MRSLLLMIGLAMSLQGCARRPSDDRTEPAELRLASVRGSAFFTEIADAYSQAMPGVRPRIVKVPDPVSAVEDGRADVTVMLADTAYFRYWQTPQRPGDRRTLRAVASLERIPLHLIVRRGAGIHSLMELSGHRVAAESPGQESVVELVLDAFGLKNKVEYRRLVLDDSIALMERGQIDGIFSVMYYPEPHIEEMLTRFGGELLPIEGVPIEKLRQAYPFLRLDQIPAKTYTNQPTAVHTIGTALVYVCRRDLPDQFVYEITKGLFDALPTASKRLQSMRFVNVQNASAVPIPLHDGAARYYREMDLQ